jgi:TBC1 domain family member 14
MIYRGVPADIRMYVWPLSIGNGIQATPEMFQITVERAQQLQSPLSSTSSFSTTSSTEVSPNVSPNKAKTSLSCIDADLNRTFPQMKLFGDGGHWGDDLRCVLEAFACHRPDVGYVQGMSYIAAMLLLHIPDRYMVFQCFTNLLVKGHLFPFYRLHGTDHARYLSLFSEVLMNQLPLVASHLQYLGIEPDLYFYPWVQTIFVKYLPANIASRVWDNFLVGGEAGGGTAFVFRTSIAIMHILQQEIIGKDMERVIEILQRRPTVFSLWETKVNEIKLFATIEKIELSEQTKLNLQRASGNVFQYHPTYMTR